MKELSDLTYQWQHCTLSSIAIIYFIFKVEKKALAPGQEIFLSFYPTENVTYT